MVYRIISTNVCHTFYCYILHLCFHKQWVGCFVFPSIGCTHDKTGLNCEVNCPHCFNGGVCSDKTASCLCPPGFSGNHCENGWYWNCYQGKIFCVYFAFMNFVLHDVFLKSLKSVIANTSVLVILLLYSIIWQLHIACVAKWGTIAVPVHYCNPYVALKQI